MPMQMLPMWHASDVYNDVAKLTSMWCSELDRLVDMTKDKLEEEDFDDFEKLGISIKATAVYAEINSRDYERY